MSQVLRARRSELRTPIAAALLAGLLAACGSGAPGPTGAATSGPIATTGATTAPATATAAPVSTAPASFQLTVTGDPNVTGTWSTSFGVDCNNPTLDGTNILFFAQSPDTKAVVLITLQQGSIGVSERAGAGATYTDREFSGTGVSAFDSARGGTFDSDLTIVPSPGSNPGTLGTITHMAGSIDCGNQAIGSSTIVATGSSAEGAINGPFDRFRAACNHSSQYGDGANVTAVLTAGTTPTYFIINFPSNGKATIFTSSQNPPAQHSYALAPSGTAAASATGAHVDGDYVEVVAAGATPHTIHLAGDVVCGTTTNS
jgi:hypothetical protein